MVTKAGIPEGYNKTEVGVIPKDWDVDRLENILENIQLGGNYPNSERETAFPLMKMGNINRGFIDLSKIEYITKEILPSNRDKLRFGDVLFNTRNTLDLVGKVAVWKNELPIAFFNSNIMRLEFKNVRVSSNLYMNYILNSKVLLRQLRRIATGTTSVAAIYTRDLFKVLAPLATLPEQTAIATALGDVDELINSLEKLIAKKCNIKQGTMQELLTGKKRLPGFIGEWEVKKLGEIGEIKGAGVDKKIRQDEIPVRLVNYLDVFHRGFIYGKHLNHYVTARPEQIQRCAVKKGDIFFTPSSEMPYEIGISSVAMEDIPDAVYSYHVDRLRLYEDWDLAFRAYIFKTRYFLEQAEKFCEGSGKRYVINLTTFRELLSVYYPIDKGEQTAIANILSEMDAEIEALEQKLDKYKMIKQGMMQELLTGKTRLI